MARRHLSRSSHRLRGEVAWGQNRKCLRSRGTFTGYLAPPAQIRTGPIRAYGSRLGSLTAKRLSGQDPKCKNSSRLVRPVLLKDRRQNRAEIPYDGVSRLKSARKRR